MFRGTFKQGFPAKWTSAAAPISAVWEWGVVKSERAGYTVLVLSIGNKNRLPFGNREEMFCNVRPQRYGFRRTLYSIAMQSTNMWEASWIWL